MSTACCASPRIRVDYDLKVPAGKTDEAQEVFAGYIKGCPAAMSIGLHRHHRQPAGDRAGASLTPDMAGPTAEDLRTAR